MLLEHKNAVIYGAGAVGGAVAQAFAREGARVFLAGRTEASTAATAKAIRLAGGVVETAIVDALDEQAIETHAAAVVKTAGSIDISFNAARFSQPGSIGVPILDLSLENFMFPIKEFLKSNFLTAQAAARRMVEQRSGAILMLTATPSHVATPSIGGFAVAWAGMEALTRGMAAELGPQGIRVVGLRSESLPETSVIQAGYARRAQLTGKTAEEIQAGAQAVPLLRHLPTLAELANIAAFMASDYAGAMTATVANISCGSLAD